jgi:hypothetical protein
MKSNSLPYRAERLPIQMDHSVVESAVVIGCNEHRHLQQGPASTAIAGIRRNVLQFKR